ncbi:MAG TPA: ATPase P [Desulfovibrio sp.]|nr:ATPase P [Desulfovibrio sp.]
MLEYVIPGVKTLRLETLLLDYNGTIARDGRLVPGVAERIGRLAGDLRVVVLTADTHGTVRREMAALPVDVEVIEGCEGAQDKAKLEALMRCGAGTCVAMGNGRNDELMLRDAALSVAVMGDEGVAVGTLVAAQVAVRDINDGLDLLLEHGRLVATLRC